MFLNRAITCLAQISTSTYNEVRRVIKLPEISNIYYKTAEMISTMNDKVYALNIDIIKGIGARV